MRLEIFYKQSYAWLMICLIFNPSWDFLCLKRIFQTLYLTNWAETPTFPAFRTFSLRGPKERENGIGRRIVFVTFDHELQDQYVRLFDSKFQTLDRKGPIMSHFSGSATLGWTGPALLFIETVNQYGYNAFLVQICQCHFDRSLIRYLSTSPYTGLHWRYGDSSCQYRSV